MVAAWRAESHDDIVHEACPAHQSSAPAVMTDGAGARR